MYGLGVGLANFWLNALRNEPFTVPITCIQLHTGDPGASGTSNASANTTRVAVLFGVSTIGALSLTGAAPLWSMSSTETLRAISVWSGLAGDGGAVFLWSAPLKTQKAVANGDKFSLSTCDIKFDEVAA